MRNISPLRDSASPRKLNQNQIDELEGDESSELSILDEVEDKDYVDELIAKIPIDQ